MILSLTISVIVGLQSSKTIPVEAINSIQTEPIAPLGGVLMVQLVSETLGNNWPSTIDVTFENRDKQTGHIGWIEKNTNNTSWTSNPYTIRPIAPSDNTQHIHPLDAMTGPVLLVELPRKSEGSIYFGGTSIDPLWVALPKSLPNLNAFSNNPNEILLLGGQDDQPEWNSLEYWRLALVASRIGVRPPEPPSSSTVTRLSALHGEHLWRIGLHKLASFDKKVAVACRNVLTNIAFDGAHAFACWSVQSNMLHQLLSALTDVGASPRQIAYRAERWVQKQQPFIQWLEGVYGEQVTVAMANPTQQQSLATIAWRENDGSPVSIVLPKEETIRAKIGRAQAIDLSLFGQETDPYQLQWLDVKIGMQNFALPIIPRKVVIHPPSTLLSLLHPRWNLRSIQRGVPLQIQPTNSTTVEVRKLLGVWELFIQCRGDIEISINPNEVLHPEQAIGIEAITILHPETDALVFVPLHSTVSGRNVPSDLHTFQSLSKDGWNVRIELPNEWIKSNELSFSIIRTHGDSLQVETAPLPCVPWNLNPLPIILDLSEWDAVQSIPTTSRN